MFLEISQNSKENTCVRVSFFNKHCVKKVRIRSYSGLHFSRIFPHSDWISRDTEIQSECAKMWEKMRTRITPNTGSFYAVKGVAKACNFLKEETLAKVFSFEFCEISKNTYFTQHLWATASEHFPSTAFTESTFIFILFSFKCQ